ncbi:hypothetical protein FIV42_06905 [Persicimonas caeni]|uniref:Uncharacterized protein n=1 Tax=Persicimonas caeni TaxID=2292766 RepID=A0A4Y6PQ49_PERCE|nr:hypothetical protein [Persicimonas caeni]QDG50471.1 hypothetical protein FIV42_06905 [Persicimonas caeni]QED31692.1 hypothetical protein FRD00_06900 [Persicimonas caeni]
MMCSNKKSGQSLIWLVCIVALVAATACGDQSSTEQEETEEFRAALVSEGDIMLSYEGEEEGTRSSALNGEVSGIAALTAETVVKTNAFLGGHIGMMRAIVSLPPTTAEEDRRTWEGTHDGYFLRVEVERSDAPRGTRFDYSLTARPADDSAHEMLTIFDGHVVRIETRPHFDKQGWGIVRYHFDHANTLDPAQQIDGKVRLAFRRVGNVRQVRAHFVGVQTPRDPNFPDAAAYDYVLLPNRAGRMKWFAKADFNQDGGQPLEGIAVHSYWRGDLSGAGVALATGGTLEVDFLRSAQCWDDQLHKAYEHLSWPEGHTEKGDRASCVQNTDDLEPPAVEENLADEDPAIPAAHPAEESGE